MGRLEVRDGGGLFSEVFRSHYNAVARFVERRVSDREDAMELTGDVFRIAWQRFAPSGQLSRAWLFGIARNVILDHYRRSQRKAALNEELIGEARVSASSQPSDDGEHPVLGALLHLTDEEQEILKLKYWEDLSAAEIGTVLRISPGAARVRLHRAKDRLHKELVGLETEVPS